MTIELTILIAIIGCIIGILTFLANRDKVIKADSAWRGSVDAKLDIIVGIKQDVKEINQKLEKHEEAADRKLQDHEKRIMKLENKKE